MSLPELCIRRPVMTTLLMVSFIVFGIFGYMRLPVAALPRVDFPTINVSAGLPGANPETMAASVAAPLERAFATIPGIALMTSSSSNGSTNITMQFDLDRNIDGAALDVQSQISATLKNLPQELPAPPSFRKVNPADSPILFLVLQSGTLPLSTTQDYAEQVFAQQISQLPGVAQVQIFGAQRFAVRVGVDPDKASARGLSLNDVGAAITAANSSSPVGTLRGASRNLTLQATGQMVKADDYKPLVISYKNGAPVHLADVATVYDSVENDQVGAWYGDQRAIILAIYRQSDANTVDVVDAVRARMPSYEVQLPPSIKPYVLNDRSVSIRQSVEDVNFTLALSIALVVLVIYIFLKSIAATIIPALALPVSLIGTCAFMFMFGYSIDNISLLAITLAVGFVVDDAIVMLENIVRHIEEGEKPFDAALRGSREIGFTILSITLSLVAVFIPVLLMGGVVGRVFREFAVTISCSILVSGLVSLTLTPMLCARILRPINHHAKPNRIFQAIDFVIDGTIEGYRRSLNVVMRFRFIMLLVTFGVLGATIVLFQTIPKGFFPIEDTGFILGATESAPDTGFQLMADTQQRVVNEIMKNPAIDYLTTAVGLGGVGGTSNQGRIFIALKPKDQRAPVGEVIGQLRRAIAPFPGITGVFQAVQNLNLNGGRVSRAAYQYTLQSGDLTSLYDKSPQMQAKMRDLPQLRDVSSDLQITNPQITIDVDREKAATYGLSLAQVKQALYNAYGTQQISTIYTQAASYQVIMEVDRRFQNDPEALGRVSIRVNGAGGASTTGGAATSTLVPLDQVATIRRSVGPLTVNRQSQQPAVTLSFNTAPGVSIGEAVEAIRGVETTIGLPASITTNFSGTAALFQDAQRGQVPLILAAVLTIYIVLGVLYESFIHPITILSGLPSAGLGAILALQVFGMDLSVIAIIGILLLVGLVKKNAIMMIDFAIERRNNGGLDAMSAIKEAAVVRFRPIIMTTFAAALGALPIALGTGAGAELRQPLGIAIVGGLMVSQVLTLYITPVVYFYLDKVDSYLSGRSQGTAVVDDARGAVAEPAE